jgi:hypothetical protein
VTFLMQLGHDVRPDEVGATDDEHPHGRLVATG